MRSVLNSSRKFASATSGGRNSNIDWQIEDNIRYYSEESDEVIRTRINELDREWDIERTLAFNASIISFTGIILSAAVNKKWLMLPAIISALFTHQAIRGWSRSSTLFGNRKIRTKDQIDQEKYALIEVLKNR